MNDTDAPAAAGIPSRWNRWLRVPAVRLILAACCVLAPLFLMQAALAQWVPRESSLRPYAPLMVALATFLGYAGHVRWLERRRLIEFRLRGASREIACGGFIGAALFTATIGCLAVLDVFHVDSAGHWTAFFPMLAAAVAAGILEEILFRGVLLRIVEQWLGSWIALAISAAVFGVIHLLNPNATALGAISIAVEAGILLGAAYMLTRRLWLPIGIHVAWNFTQGGIFGIAVSGTASHGLVQGRLEGPKWLSGGAFGAEASIVAVILCLGVALALLVKARRLGRILPPRRSPGGGNDRSAATR